MSKSTGITDVKRAEFHSIRRELKEGAYQKDLVAKYNRSQATISRVGLAKSWKTFRTRKPAGHILDTNLTKKQAKAFLEQATQMEVLKGENRRLTSWLETKDMYIDELKTIIEGYEALQSAPTKRGIFTVFRRGQ